MILQNEKVIYQIGIFCWVLLLKLLWPLPFTPLSTSLFEWLYSLLLCSVVICTQQSVKKKVTKNKVMIYFCTSCLYVLSIYIFGGSEFSVYLREYDEGNFYDFIFTVWKFAPAVLISSFVYNIVIPVLLFFICFCYYRLLKSASVA